MLRPTMLAVTLAALFLVMACGEKDGGGTDAGGGSHEGVHWGYDGAGAPEHWGELQDAYATCAEGTKQSPIDIQGPSKSKVPTLVFDYKPTKVNILNNGHAIQVNHDAGSSMTVDGVKFDLLQFHFHTPSEHTVNGNAYAMEMHLVHQNPETKELAVVGVLIERGEANEVLEGVWANLPLEKAAVKTVDGVSVRIADALPTERSIYNYDGSLTTPPCTEGVHWFLMTTPITLSPEQVAKFQKAFKHNARPVQPLNGRTISTN